MRLITRTLAFVVVILGAFWFTAENARELVNVDLAFLRVRASVPLVVFGSVLAGMGLSFLVGWRAERRLEARRAASRAPHDAGAFTPEDPAEERPSLTHDRYRELLDPEERPEEPHQRDPGYPSDRESLEWR